MTIAEYNQAVELYADGLYRFVLRSLSDKEGSRDIVQESFEKLWVRRKEVDGAKCKSYLFTTAHHTLIDRLRKGKRETITERGRLPEPTIEQGYSDLKEILNEAVEKLPEIQRSVVLLRDYEGYSYQEIGEITGLTESQVKVYIYRARLFLKAYIGQIDSVI